MIALVGQWTGRKPLAWMPDSPIPIDRPSAVPPSPPPGRAPSNSWDTNTDTCKPAKTR